MFESVHNFFRIINSCDLYNRQVQYKCSQEEKELKKDLHARWVNLFGLHFCADTQKQTPYSLWSFIANIHV